jgi:uncharacterized protein YueI
MGKFDLNITYYTAETENCFENSVQSIINQLSLDDKLPLRFVFFGLSENAQSYIEELNIIKHKVTQRFGEQTPVISYVCQKPLCNSALVLEVHSCSNLSDIKILYKSFNDINYIVLENDNVKKLSIGGLMSDDSQQSIGEQSKHIFEKIASIFEHENMPIDSIVRQWNYIPYITKITDGTQHYQEFNDARSHFYGLAKWTNGYPSATGIGTYTNRVVIDLFAVKPKNESVEIHSLDNKLQTAAHNYSADVLFYNNIKQNSAPTTPKFERAKIISGIPETLVYISGTAAIRGEESLENIGISKQTTNTLENIEFLILNNNLLSTNADYIKKMEWKSLRVYLKEAGYYEKAKEIVTEKYPNIPSVYLLGDICRENLLVEIEGVVTIME